MAVVRVLEFPGLTWQVLNPAPLVNDSGSSCQCYDRAAGGFHGDDAVAQLKLHVVSADAARAGGVSTATTPWLN